MSMQPFQPVIPITPSGTVRMNDLALKKKAAGERVYNLSAGEPILPPHPALIEAAEEALKAGKTLYAPISGIPELREAFAGWVNKEYGSRFTASNVLVTNGGKFGIYALCQALLSPGSEAVIVAPYWPSYHDIVIMYGATPVIVHAAKERGWEVDAAAIDAACTEKTKVIFLNSGNNPTGALYQNRAELGKILENAKRRGIYVVSDEVYSGLVYDGGSFVSCGSFPEYEDTVIVIQSCSKHFAMTGWRVGFVLAPAPIIEALSTIQSQSTSGTSTVGQWVALRAVQEAATIVPSVRAAMEKRRDTLIRALNATLHIDLPLPLSALYAFVPLSDFSEEKSSTIFSETLLEKGNIATVPGAAFGDDAYIRLSFGAPESELLDAVAALARYLGK